MIRKNPLKEKLRSGGVALGTFVKFSDPASVEILALSGLDFFVLDNEHVMLSRESIVNIIRAADASAITPIIRVRKNSDVEILQVLDSGALGVMVPQVNSASEAELCVQRVKYYPRGSRGYAPTHRAAGYGSIDPAEYAEISNRETFIACYCETREAVEALDEILKTPDIDVIFIGPMDLSQSYGVTGKPKTPVVADCIETIIKKVKASGKAPGIIASDAAEAKQWADKGVRFITISSDQGMILNAARSHVNKFHTLVGESAISSN